VDVALGGAVALGAVVASGAAAGWQAAAKTAVRIAEIQRP
jgi:hypothetical protein